MHIFCFKIYSSNFYFKYDVLFSSKITDIIMITINYVFIKQALFGSNYIILSQFTKICKCYVIELLHNSILQVGNINHSKPQQ